MAVVSLIKSTNDDKKRLHAFKALSPSYAVVYS